MITYSKSRQAFIQQTLADCRLQREENGYWLYTPEYEVDDYAKFKQMLTDLGGKWKRKGFYFSVNPQIALQTIIDKGISWKQLTQYFPTPHAVVREMIGMLPTGTEFWHGKRILEPSAGRGNILKHILLYTGLMRLNEAKTGIEFMPRSTVHLCELDEFNYLCLEAQIPREMGYERVGTDFMQLDQTLHYDLILANPPFTGDAWLTHFKKMVRHLAPGGRIVCVLPQNAQHQPGLLDGLEESRIVPLPLGSFRSSGTSVNTCIVTGRMPGEPETIALPIPVRESRPEPVHQPLVTRHGQLCLF